MIYLLGLSVAGGGLLLWALCLAAQQGDELMRGFGLLPAESSPDLTPSEPPANGSPTAGSDKAARDLSKSRAARAARPGFNSPKAAQPHRPADARLRRTILGKILRKL